MSQPCFFLEGPVQKHHFITSVKFITFYAQMFLGCIIWLLQLSHVLMNVFCQSAAWLEVLLGHGLSNKMWFAEKSFLTDVKYACHQVVIMITFNRQQHTDSRHRMAVQPTHLLYYLQGIVVFLVSNWHVCRKLLTVYYWV